MCHSGIHSSHRVGAAATMAGLKLSLIGHSKLKDEVEGRIRFPPAASYLVLHSHRPDCALSVRVWCRSSTGNRHNISLKGVKAAIRKDCN